MRGGGGRGWYYKQKYGGGGGRSASRGVVRSDVREHADAADDDYDDAAAAHHATTHARASDEHAHDIDADGSTRANTAPALVDASRLRDLLLHSLDGASYGAYKDLYAAAYSFTAAAATAASSSSSSSSSSSCAFTLHIDHVQGDAYAAPSRVRVRVAHSVAQYPDALWRTSDGVRRIGLADFLARQVARHVREQRLDRVPEARGWAGAKGGDMRVCVPSQAMLEQSAVVIDDAAIECRLTIGLPARGRTITGGLCHELLATLCYATTPRDAVRAHVDLYEDHEVLRRVLRERRLIAFVPDGSVLPRAAGNTELPMTGPGVVRFASPPSLRVSIDLPHRGRVKGMGIAEGVTLIVGGGFHGKSTLLHAIEVGVYNHVHGDGRELLVCDERAVKIRAEDGRCVHGCDISAFIDNLPFGKKTTDFSTPDASGSTSQATNIVEALECGATVLLMDEDTCATNLMIRDRRMQALVAREKEPITPLLARMAAIRARGVSVVMVVGGAGDYFDVADRVIQMDAYEARDVSEQARAVAAQLPGTLALAADPASDAALQRVPARVLLPQSLAAFAEPRCKVRVSDVHAIQVGDERIDMTCVEQLVHEGQTHAIAEVLESMKRRGWIDGRATLSQLLDRIDAMRLADFAQRVLGNLVRPRRFEVAAALNRMHSLAVAQRR